MMVKFRTMLAALAAALASPVWAAEGPVGPLPLWLEPVSREELRAERAQRAQAAAQGEARERTKKRGAGAYMRRVYRLHHAVFPPIAGGPSHPLGKAVVWVKAPDNTTDKFRPTRRGDGPWRVSFPAGDGGWYGVYAYADLGVAHGVRHLRLSQLTVFGHGEEPEEKAPVPVDGPGHAEGRPVVEMARVCDSHRDCYRNTTGQTVRVRVRFKGEPLAGVPLVLTTEQGWRQTRYTNREGMAAFVLVKESFPEEPDRRAAETYLVRLDHTVEQGGTVDGISYRRERYVATLPLFVDPSPLDWESQAMAFQLLAGTVLVTGGGIACARLRRRTRP